jgi:DNA polymerase
MEYFLPNAKISEIHGKPKRINLETGQTVVIMPLFHPAAALYNGAMRQTLMDDFAMLPSVIKQINEREKVLKIMIGE